MSRTVSFSKIKKNVVSCFPIKTRKDVLSCSIIIFLQVLTLVFGIFLKGFGSPITVEQRAQYYTKANKESQTYSLVYHKSDYPLSYLDYHVGRMEGSANMYNSGCKIFFTNGIDKEKNKTPFETVLESNTIASPIAFLSSGEHSLGKYFEIETIAGDLLLKEENSIVVSKSLANTYAQALGFDNIDNLIGYSLTNNIDAQVYYIQGIFEIEKSYLSKYYDSDLIIGTFDRFSKIAVNPRLGFKTCDKYLENLYFLFRITTYIDPPSYGRTTIVSSGGNDFDRGGNIQLTNLIYGNTITEANAFIKTFTLLLCIASFILMAVLTIKLFDNKKALRFVAVCTVVISLIVVGISFSINYLSYSLNSPYLGMVSALFAFAYLFVFLVECAILDTIFIKKPKNGLVSNKYFEVNI